MGTNHRREESMYLEWEPITDGKRACTWSENQSQEGRDYILGVGTNDRRGESAYLEWEPITGGKIVYTWSGNQSQKGR